VQLVTATGTQEERFYAKPSLEIIVALIGTAEAVPFHETPMHGENSLRRPG